jgi:hypothetical protein
LKIRSTSCFLEFMNLEESNLINGLYDRLAQAPAQQEDPDASRLISERVASNARAPYLLTQSVLVLQQAVTAAQGRIADLERQLSEANAKSAQGGGFLSGVAGLFGTPQVPAGTRAVTPPPLPQAANVPASAPSAGGGFLQNAMATAAGVAGGALLFQGIENLMGHGAGSFGGGGEFLGQNQPTEIINNYYEAPGETGSADSPASDDLLTQDDGGIAADDNDGGFFDSGGDDSSFV